MAAPPEGGPEGTLVMAASRGEASDIRFALVAAFREKGLGTGPPAGYDVRIVDGSLTSKPSDSQAAQLKS